MANNWQIRLLAFGYKDVERLIITFKKEFDCLLIVQLIYIYRILFRLINYR